MSKKLVLTKEYLYQKYVIEDLTSRQIAKELNIKSKTSILIALRKYGLVKNGPEKRRGKPFYSGGKPTRTYLAGKITKTHWQIIKSKGYIRKLEFSISPEYIWKLFEEQNGKCALSGIDLIIDTIASEQGKLKRTASLDRKDSSKGYIEGNVQWVHKKINQIKMDMSDDEFKNLCSKVHEFNMVKT